MMLVAVVLPGGDFFFEGRLVWNAAAQTLARQDAEFGFGHVEPASVFGGVVPFEPFGEAARFWGGKGRVERGGRVACSDCLGPARFGRRRENARRTVP